MHEFKYLKEERVSERVTQAEDKIFFGVFGDGLHDAVFSPYCVFRDAVVIDARPPVRLVEEKSAPWEDKLGHSLKHQKFTVHGELNEHNGLPLSYCFQGNRREAGVFMGLLMKLCPSVDTVRNCNKYKTLNLIWPFNEPCHVLLHCC